MKVFLVHRFNDFSDPETFNDILEIIKFFNPKLEIAYLRDEKLFWRRLVWNRLFWRCKAKNKIKESHFIINIESSIPSKNVEWELKQADKYEKNIHSINWKNESKLLRLYINLINFFRNDLKIKNVYDKSINKVQINEVIQICENTFSHNILSEIDTTQFENNDIIHNILNLLEQVKKIISSDETFGYKKKDKFIEEHIRVDNDASIFDIQYNNLERAKRTDFDLFNIELENIQDEKKASLLLQQYSIFVQSSESLMQRRQSVNNFYLSLNTGLLAALGASFTVKIDSIIKATIIIILSILGIFAAKAWSSMLISYGILNKSKIRVISLLEKNLPVSLFDAEWNVMSSENNSLYKPFTKTESSTASNFINLYYAACFIAFLVLIVSLIKDFPKLQEHISKILDILNF